MRVKITFEVSDDDRRGIAIFLGKQGKASYTDVRKHIYGTVQGELDERTADADEDARLRSKGLR